MYVKSIVLDGFKSYGHQTKISDFDRQFNVVTGSNGSGKTNILDSICFVLGITNLISQVPFTNSQNLIYKSGKRGINKARVTITWDNTDSNQSPAGFKGIPEITVSRQITLGGENMYMINGSTVPNKKVQHLFSSVHLSETNPHFVMSLGKIDKVLNMKPSEILAMIEEAVGTNMYNVEEQAAQETIQEIILTKAHEQISQDFGSILRALLPGVDDAKLLSPTGQTILQGLEVKVSVGGEWKDLTELSLGQRSLAALSLILAMSLFKPAPLYILDKVDTTLDLPHTQNLGRMLKTLFKNSQFIMTLTSWKDGMFSNANLSMFRTQSVDGVSTVTRI